MTYIGQTKRNLKTRINEHKNQINRKTNNITVITEHNEFKLDDVRIIDREKYLCERSISEMLHIYKTSRKRN